MTLHKLRYILLLMPLLLITAACTDRFFEDEGSGALPPGTPVEISLRLAVPRSFDAVVSRADPSFPINRQIFDLFVFIFAEDGTLKSKFYFPELNQNDKMPCDPAMSSNGSALLEHTSNDGGTIKFVHTLSGPSRIVAMANISVKGSSIILDDLAQITNFSEIDEFMVSTINPTTGYPDIDSDLTVMSGYYTAEGVTDGLVDISNKSLDGRIILTPLQAKVQFIVDGNGSKGGKFELKSWQVYNLPGQTPLLETNAVRPIDPRTSRLFTSISAYTDTAHMGGTAPTSNCYNFAFFPADNHPMAPRNFIGTYGERAAWDSEGMTSATPQGDKQFLNAPATATYVVMRGRFTGNTVITEPGATETVEKEVDADVSYIIFLGHDSQHNFNDFVTYRNVNYTYVVRVRGVNQISVEVNSEEGEVRADVEGNISVLDKSTEILDCHFEQRKVDITRQQVIDAIDNHTFRMIIDEPVFGINRANYRYFRIDEHGEYVTNEDGTLQVYEDTESQEAFKHMQWVQFYRHNDADEKTRTYIPFTQAKSSNRLMNVREFMADLVDFAYNDNGEETARYTLYFDEYLYLDENGNQIHTGRGETVNWNRLVSNTGSRTFTMMGSTRFSADYNSSYSTAGTAFQQRMIQTIYRQGAVDRAWGTECIEEKIFAEDPDGANGVGLVYSRYNTASDGGSIYGRRNGWRAFAGANNDESRRRISYLIDDQTGYLHFSDSQCRYLECMSRNRDLNGNGVIDADEYRWYVPSIEQLQQLYVGRAGLSADAMLYNPDIESKYFFTHNGHLTYPLKHYISSSKKRLWSEEGCSDSQTKFNNNDLGMRQPVLYLRCVRDLGTDAARNSNIPASIENYPEACFQPIYEIIEAEHQEGAPRDHVLCRIRLSALNDGAVRTVAELRERPGVVTTFSDGNKPFIDFEVADTLLSGVNAVSQIQNAEASPQRANRCQELGQGWRMPTITEMLVMSWAGKVNAGNNIVVSRSRSYYNHAGTYQGDFNKLPGALHMFKSDKMFLQDNEGSAQLRCVRDYIAPSNDPTPDTNDEIRINSRKHGHKPAARKLRR